jgi:hypothetical protein
MFTRPRWGGLPGVPVLFTATPDFGTHACVPGAATMTADAAQADNSVTGRAVHVRGDDRLSSIHPARPAASSMARSVTGGRAAAELGGIDDASTGLRAVLIIGWRMDYAGAVPNGRTP